jgi:hypothetical protein
LGLAIVRHLVELHGGTVTVQSAGEGQGTTFQVRLPVRAHDDESQLDAEPETKPKVKIPTHPVPREQVTTAPVAAKASTEQAPQNAAMAARRQTLYMHHRLPAPKCW